VWAVRGVRSGSAGWKHPRQRLEQLALGRRPGRGFGQDQREPAPQQGIAERLGGELDGEGNEPVRLTGSRTGPRDGRELLKEGQEEGGLGAELAVNGAFGEARRRRYVVEGRQGQAVLGEDPETSLEQ